MLTQCLFAPTAIRKEMDILVNDGFHTMKREVFVLNGADSMFPCCKMFTLTLYFQVLHASIVTKQTNFSQSQRQSRHHQTLMPFADFTLMYTFLKGNCHFQVGFLHIERKKNLKSVWAVSTACCSSSQPVTWLDTDETILVLRCRRRKHRGLENLIQTQCVTNNSWYLH